MPLYEYQCESCGATVRAHPEVLRSAAADVPEVRRPTPEADLVAGHSVQGLGLLHHRLREGRQSTASRSGREGPKDAKDAKAAQGREGARAAKDDSKARQSDRGVRPTESTESVQAGRDDGPSSAAPRPTRRAERQTWFSASVIDAAQVLPERPGQIRPPQREVHDGLQESELVAGVVADAGTSHAYSGRFASSRFKPFVS